MNSRMNSKTVALLIGLALITANSFQITAQAEEGTDRRFIQVAAKTKEERSAIANTGMSIEAVRSDSVWGFANPETLKILRENGSKILGNFEFKVARGGHQDGFDFPAKDAKFHNYQEVTSGLRMLANSHADIAQMSSIGKSIEGKQLWALHINTTPGALMDKKSNKPGILFVANHHAREHLSVEMPLMLAQHLLNNRNDTQIAAMLENRDIWIIPMLNPDGAEHDIQGQNYAFWRKNRRDNKDGTFGVDMNRNYGFGWGTGGSSKDTSSDVYMGTAPFSEPETLALKDFVESHLNIKILLSFHTFSELILYPWGHKYDSIENTKDLTAYKAMAETMAKWNHYTPQQSSELYIASGDTTDWSYGEHGIFSFTFELSPGGSSGAGGFYPGAGIIDRVFQDNLRPCLYLIDLADDPHRASGGGASSWLKNYRASTIDWSKNWDVLGASSIR